MLNLKEIPVKKTEDFSRSANVYKMAVILASEIVVDFNSSQPSDYQIRAELEYILRRKIYGELKAAVQELERVSTYGAMSLHEVEIIQDRANKIYSLLSE